jgi:hypothetical protein
MVPIDARLRYLSRATLWPPHWEDVRGLRGQAGGAKYRLDVLGVAGIGKTTFTRTLAGALGETVPVFSSQQPLSEEWAIAFDELYDNHYALMTSGDVSWADKHRTASHLSYIIGLEQKILRSPPGHLLINGVSILRHRLSYFSEQAAVRPDFVSRLLSDRVVILCGSADPVTRSIAGKTTRGDRDARDANVREAVTRKVEKVQLSVEAIKNLGVPVLDLDMDLPVRENIPRVAFFLAEQGMRSPAIARQAKKSARGAHL